MCYTKKITDIIKDGVEREQIYLFHQSLNKVDWREISKEECEGIISQLRKQNEKLIKTSERLRELGNKHFKRTITEDEEKELKEKCAWHDVIMKPADDGLYDALTRKRKNNEQFALIGANLMRFNDLCIKEEEGELTPKEIAEIKKIMKFLAGGELID